ncbi:MAG: hypothetical protein MUF78_10905 [Candidatus Edwardsbacteria bacterium]|jgi:hypothetical protein|nr:hypothetical protein [Candidatus Edwardsbacteria bacterium]
MKQIDLLSVGGGPVRTLPLFDGVMPVQTGIQGLDSDFRRNDTVARHV